MLNKFCRVPLTACTRTLADVAMGRKPADLVIRGAKLVNVCTKELLDGYDVAVSCGRIAAVGDVSASVGEGTTVMDATGKYLAPAFLDGHIHIESSMLTAREYARAVIPHGTAGIYYDPHEICNVLGLDGVRYMMEDAAKTPLKAMMTTPSCVPAVPGFEDTGAKIDAADVAETLANRPGRQHVVITGRDADPKLIDVADLVTEMTKVKHPMDVGRKGQKGIEW